MYVADGVQVAVGVGEIVAVTVGCRRAGAQDCQFIEQVFIFALDG